MTETGKPGVCFCVSFWLAAWAALWAPSVRADTEFAASVDRERIGLSQTVSLELTVKSDRNVSSGNPTFDAPGFDVVNEYTSSSMSSTYDSSQGGFRTQRTQQMIRVLSPKKKGQLTISNIHVQIDGKDYQAPDVNVIVQEKAVAGGRKARGRVSPFSPFGGGFFGDDDAPDKEDQEEEGSLAQPPAPSKADHDKEGKLGKIFVRAEVEQGRPIYKGEQIIVSYYIYHQMRILNLQVDKFPILNGFLREDLDIPVMGQRIGSENVAIGSTVYERSLLARYAACPLESGVLSIDPMSIKFTYYPKSQGIGQEDDFFMGFFRQMAPKTWAGKSEPLSLEVLSLPEAGKPVGFSGAVGQFQFSSTLDRNRLKANEAVTLRVQVQGQGNFSAVKASEVTWPKGLELYDTKESVQFSKQGTGSKTIDYLLIPRQPGSFTLPGLRFSFFDPVLKQYVEKEVHSGTLEVQDTGGAVPAPPQSVVPPQKDADRSAAPEIALPRLSPFPRSGNDSQTLMERGIELFPYAAGTLLLFALIALVWREGLSFRSQAVGHQGRHGIGKSLRKSQQLVSKAAWKNLEEVARKSAEGLPWREVTTGYAQLAGSLFEVIDGAFEVKSSALAREDLAELLSQKGLTPEQWKILSRIFEACEEVRYSSSALPEMEAQYRKNFKNLVDQAQEVISNFS